MVHSQQYSLDLTPLFYSIPSSFDDELAFLHSVIRTTSLHLKTTKTKSIAPILLFLENNKDVAQKFSNYLAFHFSGRRFHLLLENSGIISDLDFMYELKNRLSHQLIPEQYPEYDIQQSFTKAKQDSSIEWIFAIPTAEWEQLFSILPSATLYDTDQSIMNDISLAVHVLSQRMGGLALRKEVLRMVPEYDNLESPFLAYDHALNEIVENIYAADGTYIAPDIERCNHLLILNRQCNEFVDKAYSNVAVYGISSRINQSLLTIRQQLDRIKELCSFLPVQNDESKRANTVRFYLTALRYFNHKNNVSELLRDGMYKITYEITKHTAKTGEKYITQSKSEYLKMLYSASLGGFFVAFLCIIKLYFSTLETSYFGYALLYSLTYAFGFIVIYLSGGTLATKQPAMTAATIAKSLEKTQSQNEKSAPYAAFAALIARVFRSQFIAFAGNVLVAFPVTLALTWALFSLTGYNIGAAKYPKILKELSPIASPALFHASIAGLYLFVTGIITGNVANSHLYNNMQQRIAAHPLLVRFWGSTTANKAAEWVNIKWPGVVSNFIFGFLLGSTSSVGKFIGINLDIRHITFAAGSFAIALFGAGFSVSTADIIWSVIGIVLIGFFNFIVSFSLSLFIALRAMKVPVEDFSAMYRAIWSKFTENPFLFFYPNNEQ